jgi:hypothetical protein
MAMSEEEVAKRAGPVGQRPVLVEFKDSMHSLFGRSMGQVGQAGRAGRQACQQSYYCDGGWDGVC